MITIAEKTIYIRSPHLDLIQEVRIYPSFIRYHTLDEKMMFNYGINGCLYNKKQAVPYQVCELY